MRLLLLTLPLVFSGAAFSKTSDAAPLARQVSYYWYSYPYDTYNDYNTLAEEEWEMWVYYDAPVNTDPAGGTLIERGYTNHVYPHEFPAVYFLYVHYNTYRP
jgi:hypothetical protein